MQAVAEQRLGLTWLLGHLYVGGADAPVVLEGPFHFYGGFSRFWLVPLISERELCLKAVRFRWCIKQWVGLIGGYPAERFRNFFLQVLP